MKHVTHPGLELQPEFPHRTRKRERLAPSSPCRTSAPYVELHAHSSYSFLDGASLPEELAVRAAELGYEALRSQAGLHAEMLDMVLHHHEYLDGSGYPHSLAGNEIADLVRTITIADVYGALIEQRPYKRPHSSADAYQILVDMGPKLDRDLVRAFHRLARTVR